MLERAPKNLRRVAFARALAAAVVPIVQELEARAPVAEYPAGMFSEPGSLQDHVVTDIALDEEGNGGVASVGFGKYGNVANMVEYGHRMVAHGAKHSDRMRNYEGTLLGEVVAHPFMRPAAAASGDAAIEAFAESVETTLQQTPTWAEVA